MDKIYLSNKLIFLQVPIGGPERMKTFPKLLPTDFSVVGCGLDQSASDILLSSAGMSSNYVILSHLMI